MLAQKVIILKSKTLNIGTIVLRSDDVLAFEPVEGISTLKLSELKIMCKTLIELSENTPRLFFSNNKTMKSLGSEEREYVGKNIHLFAYKAAITENSPIVRFITHMIVYFYKPQIPMKMFTTEEEAINWLKQNN